MTAETAARVVEVYRRGGRLAPRGVRKLLRAAYKRFKAAPNVQRVALAEPPDGTFRRRDSWSSPPAAARGGGGGGAPLARVHVVGDLHGQLPELLHILDDAGMPSATNGFVFNGDFVDRGACGVEVVLALFALYLGAPPGAVCLNRGNHEEASICAVYGFEAERRRKYDGETFLLFAEVFRQLPIATCVGAAGRAARRARAPRRALLPRRRHARRAWARRARRVREHADARRAPAARARAARRRAAAARSTRPSCCATRSGPTRARASMAASPTCAARARSSARTRSTSFCAPTRRSRWSCARTCVPAGFALPFGDAGSRPSSRPPTTAARQATSARISRSRSPPARARPAG